MQQNEQQQSEPFPSSETDKSRRAKENRDSSSVLLSTAKDSDGLSGTSNRVGLTYLSTPLLSETLMGKQVFPRPSVEKMSSPRHSFVASVLNDSSHEVHQPPYVVNCYSEESFVVDAAKMIVNGILDVIAVRNYEDHIGTAAIRNTSENGTDSPDIFSPPQSNVDVTGSHSVGPCVGIRVGTNVGASHNVAVTGVSHSARWVSTGKYAIVGLSGGSTPRPVYELCWEVLRSSRFRRSDIDWSRVIFFLVDERYVKEDDSHSNTRMIKETLFKEDQSNPFPIPIENFLYPDTNLPIEECVIEYQRKLSSIFQFSRPTMVVLGLGPDGHTASWFPPFSLNDSYQAYNPFSYVAHTTQDIFPVKDRITVAMHLILNAKLKLLLLKGEDKTVKYLELTNMKQTKETLRQQPLLQLLRTHNVSVICTPPLESDEITELQCTWKLRKECLTFIILGGSGDLAIKKTFPALFSLFCLGYLPPFHIVAYARSTMTVDDLWARLSPKLEAMSDQFEGGMNSESFMDDFKKRIQYFVCEGYGDEGSAAALNTHLETEVEKGYSHGNRVIYLALPPNLFGDAVRAFKKGCWSSTGWTRCVVEKPFGQDSHSSEVLSSQLAAHAQEKELYRIDHYLGKEMVLNLFVLRFANVFVAPLWNRHYIRSVRITFKETVGTQGRGGYFDNYGIIRDVIQNHLLQILSLVAMERPINLDDENIRDEKVKVLKAIQPAQLSKTVIGQYKGYKDDPTVPNNSKCATFCTTVLYIDNERWSKVPFILKAGKALETQIAQIRLQFHDVCGLPLFGKKPPPNELVIRIQPNDAIYLKCVSKRPGLGKDIVETELDLTVSQRFKILRQNDAYERLLLDVIKGDQKNFVRTDELKEAWKIFTPLLHELDSGGKDPIEYEMGSKGPIESYNLIQEHGYTIHEGYVWDSV